MKILAWISGILAIIAIIFAFIMWLGVNPFLGVTTAINWIHLVNALLLFTIVFKLFEDHKKE
ncbi:MAG: hypothetical protein U9R41_03630 [Candidatus Marinimicrobia bacterium]|nr:hypothetical protein [Candidatus Neomarinimicrobiota bacterium]